MDDGLPTFEVGQKVEKYTGEARWEGIVVSRYLTLAGSIRYVVEVLPQHFQMIATPIQLRLADSLIWVRRKYSNWDDGFDPAEPSPRQGHEVKKGDNLSWIAQKYYGRASSWPVLVTANGLKNGDDLNIGQNIWIPTLTKRLGAYETKGRTKPKDAR